MAFKITLNGANYVDARRRQAFEAALVEDRSQSSHLGGNGHTANAAEKPPLAPVQAAGTAVQAEGSVPAAAVVVQDYDRVLDGLERGLAKSYDHQSETLRVHQQYLSNQAAYASIYAQLMQEQGTLFSGDAPVSGQSDVLLQILQSLSRSVEQFHEHQSETLTVHSQFLDQQSTYAQAFVDLLQTHYGAALTGGGTLAGTGNGNGHGNGHHPVPGVPARVSTPRLPVTAIEPTLVVAPRSEVPVETAPAEAAAQIATPVPAPVTEGAPVGAPAGQPVGAPVGVEELGNALLEIVSEKTGYPAEMLELEMDMEADLGIDSIKRVEILGALQDDYPSLPDVETDALAELRTLGSILDYMTAQTADSEQSAAADAEAASDVLAVAVPEQAVDATSADLATSGLESLGDELLAIVSDKTGYPAEMLELEMDMEADLGIDSIKRVEILGALQDQHPDLPDVETEALAELRTLAQILDYMKDGAAAKKA